MKRYLMSMIIMIAIALSLHFVLIRFVFSPYGPLTSQNTQDNVIAYRSDGRVVKTSLVSQPQFNPQIYLIGSSRLRDGIDPGTIEDITGQDVFNYGFSGALMSEINLIVKHLVENKKPDTVIIGLDFFSFNDSTRPSENLVLRDGLILEDYLKLFLSGFSLSKAYEHIKHDRAQTKIECLPNGFCRDNRFTPSEIADYIQKGFDPSKLMPGHVLYDFQSYMNSMLLFEDALKNLNENNVRTYLFISPAQGHYQTYMANVGLDRIYANWKNELTRIANEQNIDLWDFEIISPATNLSYEESSRFFNDHIHYKSNFGDIISEVIFENKSNTKHKSYYERLSSH